MINKNLQLMTDEQKNQQIMQLRQRQVARKKSSLQCLKKVGQLALKPLQFTAQFTEQTIQNGGASIISSVISDQQDRQHYVSWWKRLCIKYNQSKWLKWLCRVLVAALIIIVICQVCLYFSPAYIASIPGISHILNSYVWIKQSICWIVGGGFSMLSKMGSYVLDFFKSLGK